ncbi:FG-GAP repeat domain-containing protein [Deinococcus roseus]|uniref:FG-GAP repeat domain-containing protein n=1 Tax=Deinococcus roseus TaxID=392414 RepID=UPI00166F60B9|nr:VCBS repeat-containing protein [Deinococcus roseus]
MILHYVDYNGYRYISTRYQVRNATSAGVASNTAKTNLTLLAGETASTLSNTAIRDIKKADGTAASSSLASQILPTGTLAAGPSLASGQQSFQAFSSSEIAPLAGTPGLVNAFPYGFVVDKVGGGRTLPANPAVNDYQGTVTVSVKVPLQTPLSNTPTSFTMAILVTEDDTTQVSESLEEQALGNSGLAARVTAAGASRVNVFPGSTYSGTKRILCKLAVSSAVSPLYLVNSINKVTTFSPTISALAAKTSAVTATLGYCDDVIPALSGGTPQNQLVIHAFQTGKRLTSKNATNAGTFSQSGNQWIYTPSSGAEFKPGEVVEVTVVGSSTLNSSTRRFKVAGAAQGAAGYNTSVAYTEANSAQQIRFGDVDGDGDVDAVLGHSGNFVSVHKNNGNGTFAARTDIAATNIPQGVELGDIDNDGDLDIATGSNNNCGPCTLSIFINDGSGNYSAGTSVTTATGAFASSTIGVNFGDFNNDGNLDLAAGSNQYVTVWQGNGNGTFSNRQDLFINSSSNASNIGIGDLNNDGYQDLVATTGTYHKLEVYLNKADGTVGFNTAVEYTAPDNVRGVAMGDLNKDGNLDVVVGSIQTNSYTVYLGTGTGTLNTGTTTSTPNYPHNQMTLADINGDGNLDLVAANPTISPNGGFTFYLGNGNGTFGTGTFHDLGGNTRGVAVADLNGDGKLDVAATTSTAMNVFLKK